MAARAEEYTLGVEEEYQIVDPASRELRPDKGGRVVDEAQESLGEEVSPELLTPQVEAISPVLSTLSEVRAEIGRLRRGVAEAAAEEDGRIVAASTHPFSDWRDQRTTPKGRYKNIMQMYRRLAEEQIVYGFHVHVGMDDREAAVRVINRARVWLAPMLALSANSPFWLGDDSGYASYRTQVWGRFPAAGPPAVFSSVEEHDTLLEDLIAAGAVADATKVYWDIRISEHVKTIEFRVMDVCSRVDEAVALAGLSRALVRACHESAEKDEPYPKTRPELLRAAHWRASRDGTSGELVDVREGRAVPARDLIEDLLSFTRPALEEAGDWEEVSALVRETLERGTGADRQRRKHEETGRLEAVVDMLIQETAEGTGSA